MSRHNKARRRDARRAHAELRAALCERGLHASTWSKATCVAAARKLYSTFDPVPESDTKLWEMAVRGIGMSTMHAAVAWHDMVWRLVLKSLADILGASR